MATLDAARGVIDENMAVTMAKTLSETDLARDDLRSARAGQAASKVAAIPEVRSALLKFQQDFARREGGAVLDGRDIGTVICPNAEVKLFVTASDAVRAQRRFAELSATNPALTVAQVAGDLAQRDARDAERVIAPLQPADDAELLDTSTLSIAAAIQSAIATVQKRLK